MHPELAGQVIVQTLRTTNTFLRASRRLFRRHGLTEAQFNVLNVLAQSEGGMTQREISDFLVVDRSNVTGLLDRMESMDWIRRKDVPGDRRAWRISLKDRGRRLWRRTFPLYERAVVTTVKSIGTERAELVLQALRQLEVAADNLPGFDDDK